MTLRAQLRRSPLLRYFALTFAGSFGPSLAPIVVVPITRPVEGLRAWLSRCLQWRIGWGWGVFAALSPLAVMLLAAGLHVALGADISTSPASGRLLMTAVNLPLFFIDGTAQARIPLARHLGGAALVGTLGFRRGPSGSHVSGAASATLLCNVTACNPGCLGRLGPLHGTGCRGGLRHLHGTAQSDCVERRRGCAGRVLLAVGGVPDMQVPEMDPARMAGNPVLLRCAEADVLLGHLRPAGRRPLADPVQRPFSCARRPHRVAMRPRLLSPDATRKGTVVRGLFKF